MRQSLDQPGIFRALNWFANCLFRHLGLQTSKHSTTKDTKVHKEFLSEIPNLRSLQVRDRYPIKNVS
jgi:hypothetical protein